MEKFIEDYWKLKFYNGPNADDYFNYFTKEYLISYGNDYYYQIKVYKMLLNKIRKQCPKKYKKIHKGTPFYWIGWYSFLIGNYDQATFYLDAALTEDKKNHTQNVQTPFDGQSYFGLFGGKVYPQWFLSAASMFFRLGSKGYRKIYDRGNSSSPELFDLFENELDRFNKITIKKISLDNFINLFVDKLIIEDNTAIITTLYTFIFEKEDILEMIRFKGHGGTIEPMILHLFKAALIFETLIKKSYDGRHCKEKNKNLNCILSAKETENHYKPYKYNLTEKCSASSLEEIIDYMKTHDNNSIDTAFHLTCKIRNTTAHNLLWSDIFFSVEDYDKICQNMLNAIFFVIQKDYFDP